MTSSKFHIRYFDVFLTSMFCWFLQQNNVIKEKGDEKEKNLLQTEENLTDIVTKSKLAFIYIFLLTSQLEKTFLRKLANF